MLKPISESTILKRYSQPPGGPPSDSPDPPGSIAVFPQSPLDLPPETFENALKRREENHRRLIQWVKKNLHPDVDYGRIHVVEQCQYVRAGVPHQCRDLSHMSMLTLFKAGAEKILGVMGLTAHFTNLNQYEMACVHKQEINQVVLKCELKTNNGTVVAEGSGARHIKQDGWNLNTSIKMAQKSAIIDATIRVSGLSSVFIKTHRHTVRNNLPYNSGCPDNLPGGASCHHSTNTAPKPITQKQKDLIFKIGGHKGLTTESLDSLIQDLFNKSMENLDRVEASRFIQHINNG